MQVCVVGSQAWPEAQQWLPHFACPGGQTQLEVVRSQSCGGGQQFEPHGVAPVGHWVQMLVVESQVCPGAQQRLPHCTWPVGHWATQSMPVGLPGPYWLHTDPGGQAPQ